MLVFNPNRIFALRGIEKPYTFLVKNGVTPTVAHKLLNGKTVHFSIAHLERICRLLNCTPNDLFEWKHDNAPIAETHALNALERREKPKRLKDLIKDIPVERFDEIENLLNDLKSK